MSPAVAALFMDHPAAVVTTTWNPSDIGPHLALSNGNLTVTSDGTSVGNYFLVRSIASHSSGKFYCEFTINNTTSGYNTAIVVCNAAVSLTGQINTSPVTTGYFCDFDADPVIYGNNGTNQGTGTTYGTIGDVVSMAVDFTAQLSWFRKNGGNWNGSGTANPATGVGGNSFSYLTGGPFFIAANLNVGAASYALTLNAGGTAYAFAAPAGFGNW